MVSTLNTFAADDSDMKFCIDHLLGEFFYLNGSKYTKFACIVYNHYCFEEKKEKKN